MSDRKLTGKQEKLVENLALGMPREQAAIEAGYSDKNPGQSAYQALEGIKKSVPKILEDIGLTPRQAIEKYLLRLLDARETKFFPYRVQVGKCWVQKIDTREVAALGIQLAAFNLLCELGGWKAPKLMIKPEDAGDTGFNFQVIDVSAIPQHGGRPTD